MVEKKDWLSRLESRWSLAQQAGAIPIVGGMAGAIFAALTDFMSAWAPYSWFFGALLGAIGFQAWALLRSWQGERAAKRRRLESLLPPIGYVNLAEKRFERQRIYLPDMLIPGESEIRDKEFVDCELIGPVNVVFATSGPGIAEVSNCKFSRCDGVVCMGGAPIKNAIVLFDCRIRGCDISLWTLMFSESDKEYVEKGFEGLNIINRLN
ncbi:hypothetical protein AAG602_14350 [Citromicrobium bathyomarinum]